MSRFSSWDSTLIAGIGGLGAETMHNVDLDFFSLLVNDSGGGGNNNDGDDDNNGDDGDDDDGDDDDGDDDDDDDSADAGDNYQVQQQQHSFPGTPRPYYAEFMVSSDAGPEGPHRTRFVPSVTTASVSGGSELTAGSRHEDGDHIGGGPRTGSSLFDHEQDGMTRASRTSASVLEAAFRDLMQDGVDDEDDQGPTVIELENSAPPAIGNPSHPYHASAEPTETGFGASSATAMASLASQAAAYSSPSSSWSRSKGESRANGRRRRLDPTTEAARLPCELASLTGCTATIPLYFSGAGLDAWIAHHVGDGPGPGRDRGHLGRTFPRATSCWFCDIQFPISAASYEKPGVAELVYNMRMKHIATHFLRFARDRDYDGPGRDPHSSRRPPDEGLVAHLREVGRWDDGMEAALRRLSRHEEDEEAEEIAHHDEKGNHQPATEKRDAATTPPMAVRSAMDKAPPLTINRQLPPARDPMIIITERRKGTGRRGGPVVIRQQRVDR